MVGCIVVVGVLTRALLHPLCDFKAGQMNLQHSLIRELRRYAFKLGHNPAAGETENICGAKGEDVTYP